MLPATNDLKILRLLESGKPMYGAQMIDEDTSLKRGSIYTVLDRLVRKKLVETWEDRTSPPGVRGTPRRMYQATRLGLRTLRAADAAQKILDEVE